MRFDWLSFVFGLFVGAVVLGAWKRRIDRLRWKTLRLAVAAGIPIAQYAQDLEKAENGSSWY